ncbi:MAG: zinc-dependent metalloprotease [Gemmatimonadaceae bacterium]
MTGTTTRRQSQQARAAVVRALLLAAALLGGFPHLSAQAPVLPPIAEKTASMKALPGFFNLYWDEPTGKLFWEIDKLDTEFLYQVSMASGLGSNPIGIDRGQLGETMVLVAKRTGPRVLLLEPNYRFRARSNSADEVESVRDAFAPSVHWGFDVVAATGTSVLVDATAFFLRDARGVIQQIAERGQGTFQLDATRSALYPERIKSFPNNTEVEAMLTFTSTAPGPLVAGVAATGEAVTLREHHSFMRLPDDGYRPRFADPRIGVSGADVMDFAQPVDQEVMLHYATRFRLKKKNPSAARSEPVTPIVYYVDPGIPEPIRSAILEGTSWWNQAFEAAGYINAFRVEVLPAGADPDDIRYNMIHWNHRRTRGYSYGYGAADPRTGEIIRGNVNLGSLRLRQDYLHGQGLVAPFESGGGADEMADAPSVEYLAELAENGDAMQLALARVRQLAAHEVGHTLGFPHNYIASAQNRTSVMDYPAPLVRITAQGGLDLSSAYTRGIGEYDKLAITWLYQDFPASTNEAQALRAIADSGVRRGLLYMGHPNNNFIGAAHQFASVWDNGSNLVDQLIEEIKIRQIGLNKFGPQVIRPGEPMSKLETVLLPLYMHHRFQLRAAAQSLGGANYTNTIRGDGQTPYTVVPGAEQRRALEVLLSTLSVDFLALPERIVQMIPPPADRHEEGEGFERYGELLFDPLSAAAASAAFTVGEILHPQRMARLVFFGSMGDYPTLEDIVDRLLAATWNAPAPADRYRTQVQHAAQRATIDEMMVQASRADNSAEVRAVLTDRLSKLAGRLEAQAARTPHEMSAAADIRRWEKRPEKTVPGPGLKLPPGDPIGGNAMKIPGGS